MYVLRSAEGRRAYEAAMAAMEAADKMLVTPSNQSTLFSTVQKSKDSSAASTPVLVDDPAMASTHVTPVLASVHLETEKEDVEMTSI